MKTLHYAVAGGLLVSAPLVHADSALYTSPDFAQAAMPALNAWCSSCAGKQIIGDRFTLSARSELTSTEFAIKSNYGSAWQIHIAIFDTQLHQLATETALPGTYSVTALGNEVALVYAPLPALTLAAGDYYVVWWDEHAMGIPGYTAGGSHTQYNLSQHTELGNYGAAFRIRGLIDLGGISGGINRGDVSTVAEPTSGVMLLAGLALLGGAARRRRH